MARIGCFLVVLLSNLMIGTCKLFPFAKPCTRGPDPEWSDCTVASMKDMYPFFLNGSEEFGFPSMDPLHEDQFVINKGSERLGLTIDITNATIYGLQNSTVEKYVIDLDEGKANAGIFIPVLNMTSDYFLSGRILSFFVNGSGDDRMELRDVNSSIDAEFDILKEYSAEDGVEHEYYNITKFELRLDIKNVKMEFNNLFNGNKFLESQANSFLSRNWRELFSFLGPAFDKAVADAFMTLLDDLKINLPLEELYPYSSKHKSNINLKNNYDKIKDNTNKGKDVIDNSNEESYNSNNLETDNSNSTNDDSRHGNPDNGDGMSNNEANNGSGTGCVNSDNNVGKKDAVEGSKNDTNNSNENSNKDANEGNENSDIKNNNGSSNTDANKGNENSDMKNNNESSNTDDNMDKENNKIKNGNENNKFDDNNGMNNASSSDNSFNVPENSSSKNDRIDYGIDTTTITTSASD